MAGGAHTCCIFIKALLQSSSSEERELFDYLEVYLRLSVSVCLSVSLSLSPSLAECMRKIVRPRSRWGLPQTP